MNKAYNRTTWENRPSDATPLNERNLNKIEAGLDEVDNRVLALDTTKLDKTTAATMVKDVTYNEKTGIFTITYLNGATIILDTKLEKLAVNFGYDAEHQQLIIALDDGTKQYVDLSSLITEYEFMDGDIISFTVDSTGKVSASIKDGSIPEDKLRPQFLADIKVEAEKAQSSASAASTSETNAEKSAQAAAISEANALARAQTAAEQAETASTSADAAAISESNARKSETNTANYAETASGAAQTAIEQAGLADKAATSASESADIAADKAGEAGTRADLADHYADLSESYAVGTDGAVREGDSFDNAKYYKEQAERIAEGLKGSLLPMGTISFADLPDKSTAGYMYNIRDEFTTTARFKEGAGHVVSAGTNVYYTADGYWDCMAGSPVSSVNGQRGNVTITPENIGALPADGNAASATKATQDGNGNNIVDTYQTKTGNTANNSVTFTSGDSASPTGWTDVDVVKSGEKHSSLFGKITTMIKNVRFLYKMLGTTDISAIGGGTVTGAIASQNETLAKVKTDLSGKVETNHTHAWSSITNKPSTYPPVTHTHDDRYYTESEVDTLISQISTRLSTAARYIGTYQQQITLAGNGEFFQAIPSEWQNGGYFYFINCSGQSLNFIANMEHYNMAVKNLSGNTLSTTVQVHCFSVGV